MYLQEILEVVIGLVFTWLLSSLAAMQLQEWIANLFEWRAHALETAIRRMLTGEDAIARKKADQSGRRLSKETEKVAAILANRFYAHPIIKSISHEPGIFQRAWLAAWNAARRLFRQPALQYGLPSYIPNNQFSLVLLDIIINAEDKQSQVKRAFEALDQAFNEAETALAKASDPERGSTLRLALWELWDNLKQLAGAPLGDKAWDSIQFTVESFARQYPDAGPTVQFLLPHVEEYYRQIAAAQKSLLTDNDEVRLRKLRASIIALEATNPALAHTLRNLVTGIGGATADAESKMAAVRKNIETWFDETMNRLSGWYKRKAQVASLLIGLFLAVFLNIDSIHVANSLWREPILRQQLVAQASAYAENPDWQFAGKTVTELEEELKMLSLPFGWETTPYTLQPGERCSLFPVGRQVVWGIKSGEICKRISNLPEDAGEWLSKIVGLLITAVAVAQGAPFWFDILKKLINVRNTGPNPVEEARR